MPKVRISLAAQEELNEISDYISEDNPDAASAFIDAAFVTFRKLARMPNIGKEVDFNNPKLKGLRCMLIPKFPNYIIFYFPTKDGIDVSRILHGARDLDLLLGDL